MATAVGYQRVEPRTVVAKEKLVLLETTDVERARTDIVRICRTVWQRSQTSEAPRSISAVIIQLRSAGALPQHQANLMLTLCNLRNVHVYEDFRLGPHEIAIAAHAAAALSEWWQSEENAAKPAHRTSGA
jgi:hypothetical protein